MAYVLALHLINLYILLFLLHQGSVEIRFIYQKSS